MIEYIVSSQRFGERAQVEVSGSTGRIHHIVWQARMGDRGEHFHSGGDVVLTFFVPSVRLCRYVTLSS